MIALDYLRRLLCVADIGHKYKFDKKLSPQAVRLECELCGKKIAYNHHLNLILPWGDAQNFYESFGETSKDISK